MKTLTELSKYNRFSQPRIPLSTHSNPIFEVVFFFGRKRNAAVGSTKRPSDVISISGVLKPVLLHITHQYLHYNNANYEHYYFRSQYINKHI